MFLLWALHNVSFPALVRFCTRYVWVIEADSGKLKPGWPEKVSSPLRAIPLTTQLELRNDSVLDLVSCVQLHCGLIFCDNDFGVKKCSG